MDRYYTKVMQTFVELIKRNTADKQIVLVSTVQALKYLEDYGQRQSQLFTVLEKYHQVPQPRRSYTQQQDPMGYYPPPSDPADVQCWHTCGKGKCAFLH